MNDFDYDVMLKKRLAGQARYRKCGSKSKKCPMSTDYMTPKQWREKCGEVMTYKLRRPMPWNEFKSMPTHIQKEYLTDLIENYSATASDIGRMLGVTSHTVSKFCSSDDIQINFTPGKRMPKERRLEFEKLFSGNTYEQDDEMQENADDAEETQYVDVPRTMTIDDSKPSQEMQMKEFVLSFEGKFNREMVLNSLSYMLPLGTDVKIEIRCQISE